MLPSVGDFAVALATRTVFGSRNRVASRGRNSGTGQSENNATAPRGQEDLREERLRLSRSEGLPMSSLHVRHVARPSQSR
jgi:hypothetical protein